MTTYRPSQHDDGSATPGGEAGAPQRVLDSSWVAGLLLSLAGVIVLMGSITAEALYPGVFTTHTNTLSHLGAGEPPSSVVRQPSAAIFDTSMIVAGSMILLGAGFAFRARPRRVLVAAMTLLGLGALGVGIFPLTHPAPHTIFALVAFYAGGLAMVLSARRASTPFRQLWTFLGLAALVAITLGMFLVGWAPVAALGEGGIERWNVYLVVLWLVAYGSRLMTPGAGFAQGAP